MTLRVIAVSLLVGALALASCQRADSSAKKGAAAAVSTDDAKWRAGLDEWKKQRLVSIGGEDVESGEFQFPMQVCRGCLINYSDGTDKAKVTPAQPRNCDAPPDMASASATSGPCFIGQDLPISCRSCRGLRNPDICDPNVP